MSTESNSLKEHQPSMNVDEQIENLRSKGLIINDMEYARSILRDFSYFRLIKGYSLGLKVKNGNYYDNISFEDIVQLYYFNSELRSILYPQIEHIEIVLRSRISTYFCEKYGVLGYTDKDNFSISDNDFEIFSEELQREVARNARKPYIKNFQTGYIGGQIPLYALVEVISFGTLSKFYKNMKNEDKKAISSQYGINFIYFQSWLENLSYIRNICAHYGRLYYVKMTKIPRLYKPYIKEGISNVRFFATLLVIKHLMQNQKQWHNFIQTLELLIREYPCVRLNYIGFPKNWTDMLKREETANKK